MEIETIYRKKEKIEKIAKKTLTFEESNGKITIVRERKTECCEKDKK